MMPAGAIIPRPARAYEARTRNWWARVGHTEGTAHLYHLDQLMRRGRRGTAWLDVPGELLLLGGRSRQNSLEGWKDFIHPGGATDHATLIWYPLRGAQAAEGAINAYVDLGVLAGAFPGVTLNGHSIGMLVTSNLPGNWTEAGAFGTAGTNPIALRASSGFKGGVWLASAQIPQGGPVAAGWSMGSRTGASAAFGRAGNVHTDFAIPAIALPNQPVTLLSIEPTSANSPNQVLALWLGGPLTAAQALQQENDLMQYVRETGTWADVDIVPLVLGTNCFGPEALAQIVPADLKVYRQRNPPADDGVSAASYVGYPLTTAVARFFLAATITGPIRRAALAANPITTAAGSPTLTIAYPSHGLPVGHGVTLSGATAGNGLSTANLNRAYLVATVPNANSFTVTTLANASAAGAIGGATVVAEHQAVNAITTAAGSTLLTIAHDAHGFLAGRDVVSIAGAVPGNGLADADLNRRFIVAGTPTANSYTVTTGTAASAAGAIGGTVMQATVRTFRDNPTTFSFPRGGTFDCFVWSARGSRASLEDPIGIVARPNSVEGAAITRRNAGPDDHPPAGIECRPGFDLHRHGAGATVVQFMWVADMLARNDTRVTELWGATRPAGWGFLDVAEHYGLDPNKVIHWREAYLRADEIFIHSVQGYATSDGYVLLQNGTMANVPNIATAKKGICIDLEHADGRDPDLLEEMFFDMNQVAAALGFTFSVLGHYLTPPHDKSTGWTPGNTRRIQQLSHYRGHNISAIKKTDPAAQKAWLQDQANMTRGESGEEAIDYSKFLVSAILGIGQQLMPLDQCDAVAEWIAEKGIKSVHVKRAAQFEGGVIEHIWNQQLIRYLPELSEAVRPPVTATQALDAWVAAVVAAGDPVPSIDRQGLVLELLSPIVAAGIFDQLEVLTVFANATNITARMDMRRLGMGNLVSTASLVPDRWLLVDGVSGYYDHLWAPSSSVVMTGADQMIAVFVKDEIGQGSAYAAGSSVNLAAGQALIINPDNNPAADSYRPQGAAGFENTSAPAIIPYPGPLAPNGLYWAQKNGALKELGRDGLVLLSTAPTSNNNTLSTRNLYTGAQNLNGALSGLKAGKRLATIIGKHQSPANMQILADALTTYFTAIGALP